MGKNVKRAAPKATAKSKSTSKSKSNDGGIASSAPVAPISARANADNYVHPTADSPLRPDVGTQSQFKKRKPATTYRYDSSLSPALEFDASNSSRERGEALIREILDATELSAAQDAAA